MNKHYQKQQIKKEYAAARKAGSQTASNATKNTGKKFSEKAADKIKEFFTENKKVFLWIGVGLMCLIFLATGISSCTAMFSSTTSSLIASSYLSEDEAMLGAEEQYCQMEAELQRKLDNYEATHGYDEYHFDLDDIEHDPYVLISILSALHEGEFTLSEVQGTLQMLFYCFSFIQVHGNDACDCHGGLPPLTKKQAPAIHGKSLSNHDSYNKNSEMAVCCCKTRILRWLHYITSGAVRQLLVLEHKKGCHQR